MQKGFTLIELLIVIAIMGTVALFVFDSFVEYRDTQQVRATVVEVTSIIKETRQRTISSETDTQFGVYIATSSLTVFEGSTYNPVGANNRVFEIPKVELSTLLSDLSSEVVFARLSGVPSATGTISIYDGGLNSTTTITIQGSGLLE